LRDISENAVGATTNVVASCDEKYAHIKRVIYLNADMIVLGDINELAKFDLGGYPIAAVENLSPWKDEPKADVSFMAMTKYKLALRKRFRQWYKYTSLDINVRSLH
jgi:lipopolysaccharide biosynthesis glycosyltransferase